MNYIFTIPINIFMTPINIHIGTLSLVNLANSNYIVSSVGWAPAGLTYMCSQKECPTKFETRWLQEIP